MKTVRIDTKIKDVPAICRLLKRNGYKMEVKKVSKFMSLEYHCCICVEVPDDAVTDGGGK
jgi:hypothetical protein